MRFAAEPACGGEGLRELGDCIHPAFPAEIGKYDGAKESAIARAKVAMSAKMRGEFLIGGATFGHGCADGSDDMESLIGLTL